MDQTLVRYRETILPWRLQALDMACLQISFIEEYRGGFEYGGKVRGGPLLTGKSTALTSPSIYMGIIHSRVLLEFLGLKITNNLKVSNKGMLSVANKRKDDINIESFNLPIVTSDQALSLCTGDKRKAEAAFVQTITAANKLVAHSTEKVDLGSDEVNNFVICFKEIPVLFEHYFYKPLGLELSRHFQFDV